ncbi:MAG TPA: hypothetical protein VJ959_16420 [Desulfotignum sp.]|nr:hypothetical protein [Desulfotignum sp.]
MEKMNNNIPGNPTFIERRKNEDRRKQPDCRSRGERRHDFRNSTKNRKKSLRRFLRSVKKPRLGVDRRKGERRSMQDRRKQNLHDLLTEEEIAVLLEE